MNKKFSTVRFPAGNEVAYGQDMCFSRGVPTDVEWTIKDIMGTRLKLIAPGHGGTPYGNGCIWV